MTVDLESIQNDEDLLNALEIIRNTNHTYHPKLLLGKSKKMGEIKAIIDQIAPTDITVLLGGESGTGKELVARSIYHKSSRREKPFIKVLCAAIPDGLLESELFGHKKGSFTGAHATKPGKFEFAKFGTIFLDEIGDIPFSLQAKLLQVIQDGEFSPIGGAEVKVDVRIIVATNKNLEVEVEKGHFREDLFYRLNVVNIVLPTLRERKVDIPFLIALFMEKFKKQFNKLNATISNGMIEHMMEYNWPGNIRELENVIKRIIVLGESHIVLDKTKLAASSSFEPSINTIELNPTPANQLPEHKEPELSKTKGDIGNEALSKAMDKRESNPQHVVQAENATQTGTAHPQQITNEISYYKPPAMPPIPKNGIVPLKAIARRAALQAEHMAIKQMLQDTHWNRKEAAKRLQISYKALLYKIKECGLEEE